MRFSAASALRLPAWFKDVPYRTIWGLVWPQMAMLLCTIVINLTDIWAAGQLSADVQAAVGVSFQIQVFLLVFGMSLGAGGMAAVSQSMGAGKLWRAQNYVGLALSSCILLSVGIGVLINFFQSAVLALLQTPESLVPATNFMVDVMLCGLPFACVTQVAGTLFRAARQVIEPLLIVMVACLLNVAGDLCLGLG